jgi:hypothetical protein
LDLGIALYSKPDTGKGLESVRALFALNTLGEGR